MTVTVKNKTPLVVPRAIRRRAGFKGGEELEFKAASGVITIRPKVPAADNEYTPAQRKIIDARLKKALAEAKSGRTAGPFSTAEEMIASIERELTTRTGITRKPGP